MGYIQTEEEREQERFAKLVRGWEMRFIDFRKHQPAQGMCVNCEGYYDTLHILHYLMGAGLCNICWSWKQTPQWILDEANARHVLMEAGLLIRLAA